MSRHPLNLLGPRRPAPSAGPLADTFGRAHNNLRVSVTDRCNLRCTYCMPEDAEFMARSELLSFAEIEAFVRAVVPLGVDKVRLTGGEPLMRPGLPELAARLAAVEGVRDIGLTTNGLLLAAHAEGLRRAGLSRLNVSLDTLDPARFRAIARRDGLDRVIDGILAAKAAGFERVKVNAVAVRGFTEQDAVPLTAFCREHGLEMRFIESMPIGAEDWDHGHVYTAAEILADLEAAFGPLLPDPENDPRSPAREYLFADGGGRVGIIASVTRPFCRSCNRLRLTADGKVRNCLFALEEADARPLLRPGPADPEALRRLVRENVWAKWEGHEINSARFRKPGRTMHAIGG